MTSNNTLDRIQKEIKESIQREKELKNGYINIHNNNNQENLNNNGSIINKTNENLIAPTTSNHVNGVNNGIPKSNGFRKFIPNTNNARGVMQKFLKSRGRVGLTSIKTNEPQNGWASMDAAFKPAKISVEKGKPLRNGFVPAEEKMKKELQEFQLREAELRQERRKSQPNLMAALQLEDENEFESSFKHEDNKSMMKAAKSMANLCLADEDEFQDNYSVPCSLKPARSLAELCDVSDEEVELPGTHSLIMQFESMKTQQV